MIADYAGGGSSTLPGSPSSVCWSGGCGFPTIAQTAACADGDADGIPDAYESAKCGSATCLNHNATDAVGYTNLEKFLAGL
jgi:hypothetical protein